MPPSLSGFLPLSESPKGSVACGFAESGTTSADPCFIVNDLDPEMAAFAEPLKRSRLPRAASGIADPTPTTLRAGIGCSRGLIAKSIRSSVTVLFGRDCPAGLCKDGHMIEVDKVGVVAGDMTLLAPVSVTAHQGEALIVRGRNGTGKSTLLRVLAGARKPSSETARIGGEAVVERARGFRRRVAAMIGLPPMAPTSTCSIASRSSR
jgi:ABC-type multidrug transport system fused ATPase/permease subunit